MAEVNGAPGRAPMKARRTVGASAAALLALGATLAGGIIATAAVPDPTPNPSASPEPMGTVDDVTAVLDSYGPFLVEGGGSLAASLTITNSAPDPVAEVSVSLAVTSSPLESRGELAEFYEDPSSESMREVKSVPVGTPELDDDDEPVGTGTLGARATPQVRVAASAKDLDLPEGTAGVYGVTASFSVGNSTVAVNSMALTWLDADIASLPVTAIATIAGQPSRVANLIDGANVSGVSLAIDPTSLSAASSFSSINGRDVVLIPATHPDIASLAHGEDEGLINFAVEESRRSNLAATPEMPWLAISAVADSTVVNWADGAGALATLFEDDHASSSPDVEKVDGWVPEVTSVEIEDDARAPLLVPDAGLSDLVATFRPADPAGPSRIVAESALLAFDGDGTQGVVVSPGLDWVVSGDEPSPNLEALMSAPWVTSRTLADTLTDSREVESQLPELQDESDDLTPENVNGLEARLNSLGRLAHTAERPNSILVPNGRVLLGGVAAEARGNPERQAAAFTSATRQVDATLSAVGVVQNSDVNLIAASGEVPITVRNDLGVDATVSVHLRSSSPNLQIRDSPEIVVPAGGEATAMVPVEAVSTADVNITVWLENPLGDPVSDAQSFTMRVRADWGNAATAVFTVLLLLVMIGGIIRTVRRGRKDTRTGPGAPAERAKLVEDPPLD